jgi:hypothetical protein
MESQKYWRAKAMLSKKSKTRRFIASDINTYCKTVVVRAKRQVPHSLTQYEKS